MNWVPGRPFCGQREVRPRGLSRLLGGTRMIEVVASATVMVPSRLPPAAAAAATPVFEPIVVPQTQSGIELDAPFVEAAILSAGGQRAAEAWLQPQGFSFLFEDR